MRYFFYTLFILIGIVFSSCGDLSNGRGNHRLDFRQLKGIKYYEATRRFSNGLSFNKSGFQQVPQWLIEFVSNDSVAIWSPQARRMEPFLLLYDSDNIYNFANDYFRIKIANTDSLVLQRLEVKSKEIIQGEPSDVNMVCYSKHYIETKLKTDVEKLRLPSKADTLFIQKLATQSNKKPSDLKIMFAATTPVQVISRHKNAIVKRISNVNKLDKHTSAYDYLYPEYYITINKAYKNFDYRFSVVVDSAGKQTVNRVEGVMPEDIEPRKRVLTAILNVYIANYCRVIAGSTLGMKHPTEVTLTVVGKHN